MTQVAVNFTGVNDVPTGEMYVKVDKAELKTSKNGNPMINLQCTILQSEDDRWDSRKLFSLLLLQTDMKRETYKALKALDVPVVEGELSFDTEDLVGKECYVFVIEQDAGDGSGKRSQIKAWGIEPKVLRASIS